MEDITPLTYTPKQIQQLLNLSKNTVYKLLKTQEFQKDLIKVGNKILIPKDTLLQWIKENKGNTILL